MQERESRLADDALIAQCRAMEPVIRLAEPDDAASLSALKLATFRETFLEGGFAIPYPPDDLALFEAETYGVDRIAREIADPAHATWIAERGGILLGYAHVGPCKLPHSDAAVDHGELYQLYLLRAAQGLGLGGRFMDVVLAHMDAVWPGPQWLGVWSGNDRAQAVYAKWGFTAAGTYKFPVGSWEDEELILRRG
jgi:ribosomal protein S18 acetylase RimI-like enzyme